MSPKPIADRKSSQIPNSGRMFRASFVLTFVFFLGSLLSLLNQLTLAKTLGAAADMDAYLVAISLPLLVSGVIGSAISYSMVPLFVRKSAEDVPGYKEFSTMTLISVAFISIVLVLIGYFAAPTFIAAFASSFPSPLRLRTISMAEVAWISAGLVLIMNCLSAMQNAAKQFAIPAIVATLPYVGTISFGLWVGRSWGPIAFVWGMLVGYLAAVLVLLLQTKRDLGLSLKSFKDWQSLRAYFATMPLTIIAMLVFSAHQFIDAYWAPKLGEAALSYLGYAQRLLIGVGGIVLVAPSTVLVPRMTESISQGQTERFLNDCLRAVRTVVAFSGVSAVVISILAVPIIELVFQRGAFDHHATLGLSSILPLMMLGMTAMVGVVVLFRAIFAKPDVNAGVALGLLAAGTYFGFSGAFSRFFGLSGIAAAYAASWWLVLLVALMAFCRGQMKILISTSNSNFVLQLLITLVCIALTIYIGNILIIRPLEAIGIFSLALRVSAIAIFGLGLFYLLGVQVFRMPDVRLVFDFLIRRSPFRENART